MNDACAMTQMDGVGGIVVLSNMTNLERSIGVQSYISGKTVFQSAGELGSCYTHMGSARVRIGVPPAIFLFVGVMVTKFRFCMLKTARLMKSPGS